MGENKKRGESFARWYYARGKGQQYLLCLIPVVVAIVAMKLIIPMPEQQQSDQVRFWCDPYGRETVNGQETPKITISRDDPRFDESDLDATMFVLCATSR